jgi:hypothetical protein
MRKAEEVDAAGAIDNPVYRTQVDSGPHVSSGYCTIWVNETALPP